jgi:hypothetical protein
MFFIAGILAFCLKVHAQQKDEYKTMVDSAINNKFTQFQEATKKQNNKDYLENLYLLNEQDQPLNYLRSSSKFKLISVYDDRNRKLVTKGIYAWKVFTTLNKNQFIVNIVDFYITYKNHNYNFANGGGAKTIFEYDCRESTWKLVTSQSKGN